MTQHLLLVCHANVCRSPVMQRTLEAAVHSDRVALASAGTHAMRPLPLCAVAREVLGADAPPDDRSSAAVQLTREMVVGADMIIAATKAERAEIALLVHDARARVFTLREAILLGNEVGLSDLRGVGDGADLSAYAARMHAARGLVQFRPAPILRRASAGEPLDHADVHQKRGRAHRKGLRALQADSRVFAAQLRSVFDA